MSGGVHWDMPTHKCAECGKVFVTLSDDYAYKRSPSKTSKIRKWFCSYHCMRAFDRREALEELRQAEKYAAHCAKKCNALRAKMKNAAYVGATQQTRRKLKTAMQNWRERWDEAAFVVELKKKEAGIHKEEKDV